MTRDRFSKKIAALGALLATIAFALCAITTDVAADEKEDAKKSEDGARLSLPVAKINGEILTLEYVEQTASKQSPLLRKELTDVAKRNEFVDKLINMELLADEATKRGYENHSEVTSVRKNQLASLIHRRIADSIGDAEPTEDMLRKYYEDHSSDYHKPEKVRARHIQIKDEAKAKQLLQEILAKKTSQHDFRRLAQENSEDDSTRVRGGDLTFFTRPEESEADGPKVPKELTAAAFKLKKNGEISPKLVKTDKGFHILMRTGHRDKMELSFEDAKERLTILVRREMRKDNIESAIKALEDKFKVEIFEENLKYVVIDLSSAPPDADKTMPKVPMGKKPAGRKGPAPKPHAKPMPGTTK